MLITYLRSSSFNAWDMCQFQWFLSYGVGIKDPGKLKTHKGSIVHKAVECLARKKKAVQDGQPEFSDSELGLTWSTSTFDEGEALRKAWEYYTAKYDQFDWSRSDLSDCRQWLDNALEWNDGAYNPLKREIVEPEQYFDIPIEKPWAKFVQTGPHGERIEGTFAIKGTMDLLVKSQWSPNVYELLDWKTGQRLDWATNEVKDFRKLMKDPQLRLYHYALCHIYPDVEEFTVTIVYLQDDPSAKKESLLGGGFTLPYHRSDLPKTEDMLRRRFETIRNTYRPKQRKTWRCKSFCYFGRNEFQDSGKTICEYMHDHVKIHGPDKTVIKYGDTNAVHQYGDGGGKTDRDNKV